MAKKKRTQKTPTSEPKPVNAQSEGSVPTPIEALDTASILDRTHPEWRTDYQQSLEDKVLAMLEYRLQKHPLTQPHFRASDLAVTTFRKFFSTIDKIQGPVTKEHADNLLIQNMFWKFSDKLDWFYADIRDPKRVVRLGDDLDQIRSRDPSGSSLLRRQEDEMVTTKQLEVMRKILLELKPEDREIIECMLEDDVDLDALASDRGIKRESLLRQRNRIIEKMKAIKDKWL